MRNKTRPRTANRRGPEVANNLASSSRESNNRLAEVSQPSGDLITIARIVRPQGIKGEVIAEITTDFPDRFFQLTEVLINLPTGKTTTVKLEDCWLHQHRIVLKLGGFDNRNQAEELRGATVKIESSALVKLPADNYFEFQLIGCEVITDTGRRLGRICDIMRTGAAPLLVVKPSTESSAIDTDTALKVVAEEYLIPFAEEICREIDIDNQKITISPPEGLLDL